MQVDYKKLKAYTKKHKVSADRADRFVWDPKDIIVHDSLEEALKARAKREKEWDKMVAELEEKTPVG